MKNWLYAGMFAVVVPLNSISLFFVFSSLFSTTQASFIILDFNFIPRFNRRFDFYTLLWLFL